MPKPHKLMKKKKHRNIHHQPQATEIKEEAQIKVGVEDLKEGANTMAANIRKEIQLQTEALRNQGTPMASITIDNPTTAN